MNAVFVVNNYTSFFLACQGDISHFLKIYVFYKFVLFKKEFCAFLCRMQNECLCKHSFIIKKSKARSRKSRYSIIFPFD